MNVKSGGRSKFSTGDLVTVKNMPRTDKFCIIAIKRNDQEEPIAVLKALFNSTFIIEKPISELDSLLIKGSL